MNHTQHTHTHANGHPTKKSAEDTFFDVRKLDIKDSIRKHPWPAIAIASAVGATLGLTLGSKAMRLLVGTVGMYTLTEVLQRYAKRAISEIDQASH